MADDNEDFKPGDKLVAIRRGFALRKGDGCTFVAYTTGPMGEPYATVTLDSIGTNIGYPVDTFKRSDADQGGHRGS